MAVPLEPVATTRRTYDVVAAEFNHVTATPWPSLAREMAHFADGLPHGPQVLDAGCGPGRDARLLRGLGADVVGIDLSMGMLREGQIPGLVQADMRRLPLRDAAFDGIWCQAALLHIPRPDVGAVLAEFARVLRPHGRLHLSVSDGDGEGWETDRYGSGLPRWFVHHREAPLRSSLDEVGFEVTSVTRSVQGRHWLRMLAVHR